MLSTVSLEKSPWEEKGTTEDEMVEWHITDSMDISMRKRQETVKVQGRLICCSPWGHKSWTRLSDSTTTTFTEVI